jgi:DNA-binding LacI/PurR family transcriptional regulator
MELTEKVRRKVVDEILAGKYSLGDKLPTEREMALITGTSRITVRRAYAQLEKAGIITRRPSAGTCVSSAFAGNTNEIETIAVISSMRDPFSVEFIDAINKACQEGDILNVLVVSDMRSEEQSSIAAGLAAKGVKNIILWGFDRRFDSRLFERLRVLGMNIVFFDRVLPGSYADFVGLDNRDAIETLFKRALSEGMRRLLYIDILGLEVDSNDERKTTALKLCAANGIPCEVRSVPYLPDRPGAQAAFPDVVPEGTAVLCVNDSVATAIRPLIPSSKMYSIDGGREAISMGIVSYAQPMREMAVACMEALKRQQALGDKWTAGQLRFKGRIAAP